MNDAVQKYIDAHSKSHVAGTVLTVLFGPLGLLYSSWVAALILCVIAIASSSTIIGPIVCWILSICISSFAVSKHNAKVEAAAELGVREQ